MNKKRRGVALQKKVVKAKGILAQVGLTLISKGGRPPKDADRAEVQRLRKEHKSWAQVKQIMDRPGATRTEDAYRKLLKR